MITSHFVRYLTTFTVTYTLIWSIQRSTIGFLFIRYWLLIQNLRQGIGNEVQVSYRYYYYYYYYYYSIGTIVHCGLWPVEKGPSTFSYLPEVILFPLKMIKPRCALFECLLKFSPTQQTFECSRLLISALLTSHNQNFLLWRPPNEISPIPKNKFHWTVLITKKVWS